MISVINTLPLAVRGTNLRDHWVKNGDTSESAERVSSSSFYLLKHRHVLNIDGGFFVSFMVDMMLINRMYLQATRVTCGPRFDQLLDVPNSSAFPKTSSLELCVASI
jgi:hypothetical protein